jgi:hypothetical protein
MQRWQICLNASRSTAHTNANRLKTCTGHWLIPNQILMVTTRVLARYAAAAALCSARTLTESAGASHEPAAGNVRANPAAEHTERLVRMSWAWGGSDVMPTTLSAGTADQSPPREAVQRVLRELHQVQRLLVALGNRRKASVPKYATSSGGSASAGSPASGNGSNMGNRNGLLRSASYDTAMNAAIITPLSKHALDVVEGDVRRCLAALSTVVRAVLCCS